MKALRIKQLLARPDQDTHLLILGEEGEGVELGLRLSCHEAHQIGNEISRASGAACCPCAEHSMLNLVEVLLAGSNKRIVGADACGVPDGGTRLCRL